MRLSGGLSFCFSLVSGGGRIKILCDNQLFIVEEFLTKVGVYFLSFSLKVCLFTRVFVSISNTAAMNFLFLDMSIILLKSEYE